MPGERLWRDESTGGGGVGGGGGGGGVGGVGGAEAGAGDGGAALAFTSLSVRPSLSKQSEKSMPLLMSSSLISFTRMREGSMLMERGAKRCMVARVKA